MLNRSFNKKWAHTEGKKRAKTYTLANIFPAERNKLIVELIRGHADSEGGKFFQQIAVKTPLPTF